MDEELSENPYLEKFYEYLEKKLDGPNPYSFPLQKYFMMERFKREKEETYINNLLIQD